MRDVLILVGANAGPGILFTDPTGDHCLENVRVVMENPAASAIQGGTLTQNGGINMTPARFRRMRLFAGAAHSKPLVALYGKGGGLNNITFEECWIEGALDGKAPLVVFEATDDGLVADVNFEKCIFEIPIAGAIRFRSVSRVRVSACWAGDLERHPPTNPIFDINSASVDSISGAIPSQDYLFDTQQTDAGQHGAATTIASARAETVGWCC